MGLGLHEFLVLDIFCARTSLQELFSNLCVLARYFFWKLLINTKSHSLYNILRDLSYFNPWQWVMHKLAIPIVDGVKGQIPSILNVRFTRHRGVGTGGGSRGQPPPQVFKSALFPGAKYPLLPLKRSFRLPFCPTAFVLWLPLFLYLGMSWKCFFIFWKNMISPENFLVCPEIFLRWLPPLPPPSPKKILGPLFHSKSAPHSLPPPPTFRCFIRPWLDRYNS